MAYDKKNVVGYSMVGALFVSLAFAVWLIPRGLVSWDQIHEDQRALATGQARQAVLWAAGGIIAIVGLWFTWRRDQTILRRAELDQDANFTSRYTEAITQLGDTQASIQLGGIFALERIAYDSTRDRQTIIDVLVAHTNLVTLQNNVPAPMKTEIIRSAMTVIGRIVRLHPQSTSIVYTGLILDNAIFVDLNLMNMELIDCQFNGTLFQNSDFSGVVIYGSSLESCRFKHCNLDGAQLYVSRLSKTRLFDGSSIRNALIDDTRWTDSEFYSTNIGDTRFAKANLENTVFRDCDVNPISVDLETVERSGFTTQDSLIEWMTKTA